MMDLQSDAVTHMRRLDKDVSMEEARKCRVQSSVHGFVSEMYSHSPLVPPFEKDTIQNIDFVCGF